MTKHHTYGTAYFRSLWDAYRYYRDHGTDLAEVERKVKDGEFHIGKPPKVYESDELFLIKDEGRYAWRVQR